MPVFVSTRTRLIEDVEIVAFTFASTSPMILRALAPGQVMDRACILVQAPFDGVAPLISLGTFADPERFLANEDVLASTIGQYETNELGIIVVPDFLILTITASGSTQGAASVFYKIKR